MEKEAKLQYTRLIQHNNYIGTKIDKHKYTYQILEVYTIHNPEKMRKKEVG